MAGRSVRLFLVDGSPQGMRTAEVGNWTGLALVCPRTDLSKLAKREEVRRSGVYFLVGPSEAIGSRLKLYIGEADDVWARLQGHSGKDFWTWVIMFVSKDLNLTKAHVRWLEARLVEEAKAAKRADVENGVEPGGGRLPEADAADMETFLENVRLLLPVLGIDVLATDIHGLGSKSLTLELKWEDARAECVVRDGQFIVKKGSTARAKEVDSLGDGYRDLRHKLKKEGVLQPCNDTLLRFSIDYAFDSPSAAAAMVSGTGLNGRVAWRVKGDTITYKEWQEQQVAAAAPSGVVSGPLGLSTAASGGRTGGAEAPAGPDRGPRAHAVARYSHTRLCFKRDIIEPLAEDQVFEVETPHGTFRMTKRDFRRDFANVEESASYRDGGIYHYEKTPARAEKYLVRTE